VATNVTQLEGLGCGRSLAMVLGSPPCLSANVKVAFVNYIINGDDVVCQFSRESLDHLCSRVQHGLKGGAFGRQDGWMTDAVSLTVSHVSQDIVVAYNGYASQCFWFNCHPGVELKDTCPWEQARRSLACRARSGDPFPTSVIRRNL
jgi:hypothetical protein